MQLTAGVQFAPNLRLKRPLGQGGMAAVWVADHLALRTEVAVKFIDPQLASGDPVAQARFVREASTAAQIKSPHVVQMFDHGFTADGTPYIVMELLHGESLHDRLKRVGKLPPAQLVTLLAQCALALDAAHRLGIVHRDIKPANLFLGESGYDIFVKVLDFGIAKSTIQHDVAVNTGSFAVIGTPRYMSPEQLMSSKHVTHSTDIWALGVVAYQALMGRPPYEGDTVPMLTIEICTGDYTPPSALDPTLPPALDAWFSRVFERVPSDRFASAGELAEAFKAACTGMVPTGSLSTPSVDVSAGPNMDRACATAARGTLMMAAADPAAVPFQSAPPSPSPAQPTMTATPASAPSVWPTPQPVPATYSQSALAAPPAQPISASTAPSVSSGANPQPPKSGRTALLIALVGVLVLAGVGVGAVMGSAFFADSAANRGKHADASDKGAAAACVYERCDRQVKVTPRTPVEPKALVASAGALARQLEPKAKLTMISASEMRGGKFAMEQPGSVSFMYRYPKQVGEPGAMAAVHIIINHEQMMARHASDVGLKPVADPGCDMQQALAVAIKDGLSASAAITVIYSLDMLNNKPTWRFNQADPPAARAVDGTSCKLTQ